MNVNLTVKGKGNADFNEKLSSINAIDGVTAVGAVLPSKQYYSVTIQPADTGTDKYGDANEAGEEVVKYFGSKSFVDLEDDKALLDLAVGNGIAGASAVKEKRVAVAVMSRNDYSIAVNDGIGMGDEKIKYVVVDKRGLWTELFTYTSKKIMSDEQFLALAVKEGAITELNIESGLLAVKRIVKEEAEG